MHVIDISGPNRIRSIQMNIVVVSPYHKYSASQAFTYPLKRWSNQIAAEGINIRLHKTIQKAQKSRNKVDCCVVDSKVLKECGAIGAEGLIGALPNSDKYILADTTDSCSWLLGEYIDYFDSVWKGQMYRDKSLYLEMHYGGRYFTNDRNIKAGIEDDSIIYNSPLKKNQLEKLKISWNSCFRNYLAPMVLLKTGLGIYASKLYPEVIVNTERTNLLSARFSVNYDRNTITYGRSRCLKDAAKNNRYKYY